MYKTRASKKLSKFQSKSKRIVRKEHTSISKVNRTLARSARKESKKSMKYGKRKIYVLA